MRILMVEDDRNLVLGLRHNLELDGHRVEAAYSGTAGLERARAREADFIMLDLMIPGPTAGRCSGPFVRRAWTRR
jgi:two-component system alkaline phosphatase synthesis response regulator PhoP